MQKPLIFLFCLITMGWSLNAQTNTPMMKDLLKAYSQPTFIAKIKGNEIAYTQSGHGKEVIVFIHGLSSNAESWTKNIEVLKDKYTCIAVDLPGYGRSYKTAESFTPSFFAETIKQLLDQLGHRKVYVVGHSMGGQTAIKLTVDFPEIVRKLVLVAPAGVESFTQQEAMMIGSVMNANSIEQTSEEQIVKNYDFNFFSTVGGVQDMINDRLAIRDASDFKTYCSAIEKSVKGMLQDPTLEDLPRIKVPTLVLFGEEDRLIHNPFLHATMSTRDVADLALAKINNSKSRIVPEAGHFLQFEKAEIVNQEIQQFLEK